MSSLNADEVITQKHKRAFIQYGGPQPGNPTKYGGQDAQYMFIDGVSKPETGSIDPIWVPDPRRIGKYKLVGRAATPPDLASASLVLHEAHGTIPRQLLSFNCAFNFYEVTGACQDLSDFSSGWTDYVMVYSNAIVTEKDYGTRTVRDGDELITDTLSVTLSDIYPVGAVGFDQEAANLTNYEVVDVVFGSPISCQCSDGADQIYVLEKSTSPGSPGLPANVIYSVDSGGTWTEAPMTPMGATEVPYAIDIVGKYLVVIGEAAWYFATINQKTGVPGAFTKVTSGLNVSGDPRDMYVSSPREVFICGLGGYIYKATDITAGVAAIHEGDATSENLARIHGYSETIVAVGANGAIVKSTNRGVTWALAGSTPTAANITSLWVLDSNRYWIGTDAGYIYYTLDGGETWTAINFTGVGTGAVYDIVFPTDEVGWFSWSSATPTSTLFTTWSGGADWTTTTPRIMNFPVCDRINRLATPDPSVGSGFAANTICGVGLAGNGSDGLVLLGVAGNM